MAEKRTPEIRFKGFEDEWEKKPLGEYLAERDERTSEGELLSVTINQGVKLFSELGRHDNSSDDKSKYKKVYVGDIAYNSMRMWQGASGHSDYEGIVSPAYTVLSPTEGVDTKFFVYLFKSDDMIGTFQIHSQGITSDTWNLKYPTLKEIVIAKPQSIEEQKGISSVLEELDSLISLQETKFKKLKILKISMLEKMFPKGDETVPEIRFGRFCGEWERRTLSDVATKVNEKNVQNIYSETFTNSAEYGVISQRDFFDHDISKVDNIGGYYVVQNEDFVYNPRISVTAPCGPINRNKLGRTGVMSPLYTVFKTHDIDRLYLEWYFKSNHWHPFMYFNGDSGARSDRFSIKNEVFFQMPTPYPSLEEQEQIGSYLQKLDNLITLNQQKFEKLKNIKAACLEKMFV